MSIELNHNHIIMIPYHNCTNMINLNKFQRLEDKNIKITWICSIFINQNFPPFSPNCYARSQRKAMF